MTLFVKYGTKKACKWGLSFHNLFFLLCGIQFFIQGDYQD